MQYEPRNHYIGKKIRGINLSKANNPNMLQPTLFLFIRLLLHFRVTGGPKSRGPK